MTADTTRGTTETMWTEGGVRCVIVPSSLGMAVELRNEHGAAFLKKQAPSLTAARNEAEYLRLLLGREQGTPAPSPLKPFALIVEDEIDTAEAYREALRFQNVRALSVPTGTEALKYAVELLPDLVILDYRLPDMHGAQVCARLRANPVTKHIPVLVVSASPQDPAGADCPDAILTKPCLLPTLLAASRLLLRRVMPTHAGKPSAATT
jgi:CheY-like chemotaxis protein